MDRRERFLQPAADCRRGRGTGRRDRVFPLVSTLGTVTNLAVLPFLAQRGVPIVNPAGGHKLLVVPIHTAWAAAWIQRRLSQIYDGPHLEPI
jgi:hypothetical protein